jgi:hypothetical protein
MRARASKSRAVQSHRKARRPMEPGESDSRCSPLSGSGECRDPPAGRRGRELLATPYSHRKAPSVPQLLVPTPGALRRVIRSQIRRPFLSRTAHRASVLTEPPNGAAPDPGSACRRTLPRCGLPVIVQRPSSRRKVGGPPGRHGEACRAPATVAPCRLTVPLRVFGAQ